MTSACLRLEQTVPKRFPTQRPRTPCMCFNKNQAPTKTACPPPAKNGIPNPALKCTTNYSCSYFQWPGNSARHTPASTARFMPIHANNTNTKRQTRAYTWLRSTLSASSVFRVQGVLYLVVACAHGPVDKSTVLTCHIVSAASLAES